MTPDSTWNAFFFSHHRAVQSGARRATQGGLGQSEAHHALLVGVSGCMPSHHPLGFTVPGVPT